MQSPSEKLRMIHKLNYHDKWPTSDYNLQNTITGFVLLYYYLGWQGDKVGGVEPGYHLLGYSVVSNVCKFVLMGWWGWLP